MANTFLIKNGDWVLDESLGRPIYTSGNEKTRQDFRELLSIEIQSNGYGAGIVDLAGQVPENPIAVSFQVMERISDAVNRWMGLQRKNRAILEDNERVVSLSYNQAAVDDVDFTKVTFRTSILTKDGTTLVLGGNIMTTGG